MELLVILNYRVNEDNCVIGLSKQEVINLEVIKRVCSDNICAAIDDLCLKQGNIYKSKFSQSCVILLVNIKFDF